jgi:tRNA-2-methylthio-N6-dimethylallyladenosine synthase
VLNTCSVREKAEQKLRSEVGRLAKKKPRGQLLVVAGCVAQQEGERLLKTLRGIDLVIGPDNIPELPRLLDDLSLGGPPVVRTVFDTEAPSFLTALGHVKGPRARPATAFVTIMKGCDERCSFCIVPTTRGPERYRPSPEIVSEISGLVENGVGEVTLLGQTVNSYTDPLGALDPAPGAREGHPDESAFAALLRRIAAAVPELGRLRYTSPHPRHLTPSLVRAHAELPVLARHVHLPVQSGSDRMLRRMIRRYTRDEYVERVTSLVRAVPGVTLSTDIIVGFPGETEEDFQATLDLVDSLGFTGVFGFKYSPRPGTPALRIGDDVTEAEKRDRLRRLFERSEALLSAHLKALVGTEQRVLV